ncbi:MULTISPECIES: DMT family transporter [unclassified Herbaspirillum]|uniref:DMT family transporter n=1 Tax=unclassified Herbaspirillum TaxID=2624150 RepID=UPI0011520D3D|nr:MULTISPECIES: DMT family transporter [unclassified Herbaspirillum]MBB5391080.1 drug/metabolite transporter (DMT)-like permease [Herbaspirillum sp. SJZ102]TQK13229.1 drug/metabolite transporter (DMT)-like permease [Herbaspirillum sp. SJZ130]TQK15233.1 drug/metabolite transporter (DMT)-like permease [Herbaspirillum sp. SJZ106]
MQLKYVWFPLGAVLIWAGNTVISKMSAGVIAPEDISFYRWVLAAALMSPFLARSTWHARAQIKPHLGKILVLALLGMVLFQSLAYFAAATSSATSMGIIASLMPLLTLLLSIQLLSEPPTVGTVGGGVLSLFGLAVLIGRGHPLALFDQGVVMGDLLMLLATISYGLYGVMLRRWALPLRTWQLLYMQVLMAVLLLFPGFVFGHHSPVTADNLPLLLYAGIAASIVSQFLWMKGVNHLGASHCSVFVNLMPVFTVAIAMLALGEELHGYHAIGGGITLAGVLMAQMLRQRLPGRAKAG